jgi:hypothetical protein
MGRYYNGDVEGKFWLGVQPSDAAERFGALERSSNIPYGLCKDDFDVEELESLIKKAKEEYGLDVDKSKATPSGDLPDVCDTSSVESNKEFYEDGDMADLELGLKLYAALRDEEFITFEAEC